jgi:hypothetical protein
MIAEFSAQLIPFCMVSDYYNLYIRAVLAKAAHLRQAKGSQLLGWFWCCERCGGRRAVVSALNCAVLPF